MPSADTKPIIHNPGAFFPQPKSISVITIQTPTEFNPQHIYALDTSNDLPLGLLPLAVDHKISHKYLKSLSNPIPKTACDRVHVPRAILFSTLNPIEIKSTEVSNISWTKTGNSQLNRTPDPTTRIKLPTRAQ